tara:strand:+ start:4007 stop:5299 length:1293 start_codon:yes stop_codon:yes gene_type:complete
MLIAICITESPTISIAKIFIEKLLNKNFRILLVTNENDRDLIFNLINTKEELDNLFSGTNDSVVRRRVYLKKSFLPKINLFNSYNISLKRLFMHLIYPLLHSIKLSYLIDEKVKKSFKHIEKQLDLNEHFPRSSIVFVLSDRNLWLDLVISNFAVKHKIKIILPYFSRFVGPDMLKKKSYYLDKSLKKSYYPNFIENYIQKYYGLNPKDAFTIGNLSKGYLICNNKKMQSRFIKYGISKEKLPILGDLNLLRINNIFQHQKEYILIAVPQFYEHNMMSKKRHFKELELLVNKIKLTNRDILLSLHPRSNINDYLELAKRLNILIPKNFNLLELLPNAKYLVCTFSSTYEFALKFGKSVVMVDHYFKYSQIDSIENDVKLTIIKTKKDYNDFSFCKYEKSLPKTIYKFKDKYIDYQVLDNYIGFIKTLITE